MKPIKIAFLWHQHQPFYLSDGEFILPWVRFHAVKDYLEMLLIQKQYPKIKQTFNIVPSLFKQIELYLQGTKDRVQVLSAIQADLLTSIQKQEILNQFFVCNLQNMIAPYPRYLELYDKANANEKFNNQDFLDLQVWYNLTWFGTELKNRDESISKLLSKNHYTEEDKHFVLAKHLEIMAEILPTFKSMLDDGNIDISVTPYYHPILPLLIDTNVYHESSPDKYLPFNRFAFPQDAKAQMQKAIDFYVDSFGRLPKGVWASEGSLSNQTLELFAELGFEWTASDEKLLFNSQSFETKEKYRIFNYQDKLNLFFRDTELADKIGFDYSQREAKEASNDFIKSILAKRDVLNDEELESSVFSIILDGENCWEFYKNNGYDFLHNLYRKISESDLIETVTFSEAIEYNNKLQLTNLKAGSWINANFDIWIGHQEDRLAWDILFDARTLFEEKRESLSKEICAEILELIYICEGSDWFWWFGNEFRAPNRKDFDILFRKNISKIYKLLDTPLPKVLTKPIMSDEELEAFNPMTNFALPIFDGKSKSLWQGAGSYIPKYELSTMNSDSFLLDKIYWYIGESEIYLKIIFNNCLNNIKIRICNTENELCRVDNFTFSSNVNSVSYFIDECWEVCLPLSCFNNENKLQLSIELDNNSQKFPVYNDFIDLI